MSERIEPKYGPIKKIYLKFRDTILSSRCYFYRARYGMNIHPTAKFSMSTKLDKTNPKGVNIGKYTYLAFGSVVLTHDMCRRFHASTFIGESCFIGAHAIIMPGVKIGNQCIIGAGSVVVSNVPDNCIAAGNPAKIIRTGIKTEKYGKIIK